jgi:hypothetical protein
MANLTIDDLETDFVAYAAQRDSLRREVMDLKKRRRLHLGDIVTFVFENRATLRWQVQEMLYAERISDPTAIQAELDTYNPQLPSSHELSATMFLEIPDMATLKAELPRLAGIENTVSLTVDGELVKATGEQGRSRDDYTSTVHYIRFPLTDDQRDVFRDPQVPVELSVDHPAYSASTPVTGDVRLNLLADLALA